MKSNTTGYIFAGLLGALAGGIGVAVVTHALPKMMARMMNEMMQSVSDLAGIVKDSVTDKAAKDKCDAIIARVGELIKRHDEMYKAHQQKMDEMMKSHQEKMKQRGEKM